MSLEVEVMLAMEMTLSMIARCQVDRALDSSSRGLGFDFKCWPCVEVLDKLRILHCLGPPSHNGCLLHRSKAGSRLYKVLTLPGER